MKIVLDLDKSLNNNKWENKEDLINFMHIAFNDLWGLYEKLENVDGIEDTERNRFYDILDMFSGFSVIEEEDLNEYETMLIEEIDMVLETNWDNEIDLPKETKIKIARDIIDSDYDLWEDLMCITIDRVKNAFLDRKKYLLEKQKVCELDKEEK
jgi:hypothetical protein